ncbi:MAG TPA: response regulator [Bryobacteraceae bacterium]|nr:response regulator [Bryobacteraceae bacterium]
MSRTVLIVEDAEICRDTLEIALMKVPNLAVRSVTTAEEALQWLAANQVSVLVTDIRLPRMDGFALIEAVRSRCSNLPIVVISGDSDPRLPAHVAGLGVSAYFPKPYSPTELLHKLEELIGASAA